MSGQPSPYSTPSDAQRDARRWRFVLQLTRRTVSDMSPSEKAVWDRILFGGWFVDDLVARIDAILALETPVMPRGGYAGTEQE